VKDLELQQDAARRSIGSKEQQLKPLETQGKDRSRQALSECLRYSVKDQLSRHPECSSACPPSSKHVSAACQHAGVPARQ